MAVLALVGATMFGFVPVAEAHTDFESSSPGDGEVVDQPVSEIRLRFTAASMAAGDGFVVRTPAGELVQPEVRVSEDEQEFTLIFVPPLTDGIIGVQWSVRAGDAHPIEGALSFTTTAMPLVKPVPSESDSVDPSVAPSAGESAEETTTVEEVDVADSETELAASADTAAPEPDADVDNQVEAVESAAPSVAAVTLEEFMNTDTDNSSAAAGPVGYLGRVASQTGSLVAIGVVGFALLVGQGTRKNRLFVHLIRQAAVLTVVGALVEAFSLVLRLGSVSDALVGTAGIAIGLRVAGAAALVAHSNANPMVGNARPDAVRERVPAAVGGGSFSDAVAPSFNEPGAPISGRVRSGEREQIEQSAWIFAGLIAVSYAFDGHTVTEGNRLFTSLIDVVHVAGGAIWLGGLICLFMLSRHRSPSNQDSDFIATVVRFSVVAAAALAAVGAAGLILTVTILDSVSELWTTGWGRILIAKVLIVLVAVGAGAFNHFVLVPEMQSVSVHSDARQSFVRTMVIELIAIGVAVALTAFLVAAAA